MWSIKERTSPLKPEEPSGAPRYQPNTPQYQPSLPAANVPLAVSTRLPSYSQGLGLTPLLPSPSPWFPRAQQGYPSYYPTPAQPSMSSNLVTAEGSFIHSSAGQYGMPPPFQQGHSLSSYTGQADPYSVQCQTMLLMGSQRLLTMQTPSFHGLLSSFHLYNLLLFSIYPLYICLLRLVQSTLPLCSKRLRRLGLLLRMSEPAEMMGHKSPAQKDQRWILRAFLVLVMTNLGSLEDLI